MGVVEVVDFCGRGAVRDEGIGRPGGGQAGKGRGEGKGGFWGTGVVFIIDPAARRAASRASGASPRFATGGLERHDERRRDRRHRLGRKGMGKGKNDERAETTISIRNRFWHHFERPF